MNTEKPAGGLSRRDFISRAAIYTGGLVVAFHVPKFLRESMAAPGAAKIAYPPNAFLYIAPDDTITLTINRLEMGQGVNSAFAQLIAEELGCDYQKIHAVASNADTVYNTPGMPFIITGGSMSVRTSFDQYRKIGAGMREMLISAAAKRWNVPASSLHVEAGNVIHAEKGKLTFGELANEASQFPFPENPTLKAPKDFKIIGKAMKRVDADAKSTGKAIFGIDVRLPGMLYAMVAKPPFEGSKLISIDEAAARKVPGVVDVVKFADRAAVVAKNTHAAHLGQKALNAKWDSGTNSTASTDAFMKDFIAIADKGGTVVENRGAVDKNMTASAHKMTLEYQFPFLSHAQMEPLNVTIDFNGDTAELYSGFQMPTGDVAIASKIFGIAPEKVKIHVTYAGGSFGRRGSKDGDYTVEACELAKVLKKPVKIMHTREDDMRGGYYRPMHYHRIELGTDAKKNLLAWNHYVVGQSIFKNTFMAGRMIKDGVDETLRSLHFGGVRSETRTPLT
jgi:isoquinoline 1-oxidoreductase beta subunit